MTTVLLERPPLSVRLFSNGIRGVDPFRFGFYLKYDHGPVTRVCEYRTEIRPGRGGARPEVGPRVGEGIFTWPRSWLSNSVVRPFD